MDNFENFKVYKRKKRLGSVSKNQKKMERYV